MHTLRTLSVGDADQLSAIDRAATDYPWSCQQFIDGLAGNEFGWGLDCDGTLVAFALFSQVLDEATLLNVATHPAFQRRGFARVLLQRALTELSVRGAERCLLEVRASNQPALALYGSLGFSIDGCRRNYYPALQGREDALLMSAALSKN